MPATHTRAHTHTNTLTCARARTHPHTHTHIADQFPAFCVTAVTFAPHSTEIFQLKYCTIQYFQTIQLPYVLVTNLCSLNLKTEYSQSYMYFIWNTKYRNSFCCRYKINFCHTWYKHPSPHTASHKDTSRIITKEIWLKYFPWACKAIERKRI
jgi:hypothetical protein